MTDQKILKIEEIDDGYLLNGIVHVRNIDFGKSNSCDPTQKQDATYDIEYNDNHLSVSDAISIAETFFSDVIATYLSGKFVQKPPDVISKKLCTP
jgi:hypothetical protein